MGNNNANSLNLLGLGRHMGRVLDDFLLRISVEFEEVDVPFHPASANADFLVTLTA